MREQVIRRVVVVNTLGVHARPASALVQAAGRYQSEIQVAKGELRVNCKSIMGVLMLAAERGSTLEFSALGDDAHDAVDALCALVDSGFPGMDEE